MLRAKRRRTRTHDKDGNPIFNTMNSTPLQSVYKNVNNNFKQSNCCEKTIACRYNNCGTTTYIPNQLIISFYGPPNTRDADLIIDGVYDLVKESSFAPVYYNRNKGLYLGLYSGNSSPPATSLSPIGQFWSIGYEYPNPTKVAKWYFMYTDGSLLNESSNALYSSDGELVWSMGVVTNTMSLTDIKPNFVVTIKNGEKYTCCWSSKNRNPIPGYRKKLDCTRSTCTNLAYFAVQETQDGFGVAASIKDIYTDSGFIIPQVGSVKNFADCAFISAILQYSSDCKTRIDITAYGMPAIYNGIYYLISNAPSPIYKNNNGKFLGLYYGSIAGGAGGSMTSGYYWGIGNAAPGSGVNAEYYFMDNNGTLLFSGYDTLYTDSGTNTWLMGQVGTPITGPPSPIPATTITHPKCDLYYIQIASDLLDSSWQGSYYLTSSGSQTYKKFNGKYLGLYYGTIGVGAWSGMMSGYYWGIGNAAPGPNVPADYYFMDNFGTLIQSGDNTLITSPSSQSWSLGEIVPTPSPTITNIQVTSHKGNTAPHGSRLNGIYVNNAGFFNNKLITIKDNTNDTIFWTGQVTAIGSNFLEFIGLVGNLQVGVLYLLTVSSDAKKLPTNTVYKDNYAKTCAKYRKVDKYILQNADQCKTIIDITESGMQADYNGKYCLISASSAIPIYKNNNGKFLGLYYGFVGTGVGGTLTSGYYWGVGDFQPVSGNTIKADYYFMDDNGNLIQSNNDTLYTSQGTNSWLMGEVIVTSGPLGPVQEINATTIAYLHVPITVDQSPNDCAYNQTKKRIQNRNGWMNDKYNYSTKQYLERRCRSFNKQSFNFLSNQAISDSSRAEFLTSCQVSNIDDEQGSASRSCRHCEKFIIISDAFNQSLNGRYDIMEDMITIGYKQVNGNYFIGLYSGYINNAPPTQPPGAPAPSSPALFWGINAFAPPNPTTIAEYYFMDPTYGTLVGENNFNLKHNDTFTLSICETLMSSPIPNTQVQCKTLTLNYNIGCCLLNCNNILGIDCSLNTMKCTQTSNDCAKKGYTLCEAQNNNCKAVYKRSNPKFSTQGAVSGGSRINRLKYQAQLKAQSVQRPTKFFQGGKPGTVEARPYTTAANNNMTYRGTPYEKVNTTRGVNATNGTYPVSLYRNTYPQYKGNLSGLCLGNMGLTLNNRPQRCVMPPGQPACRALQTLPEKCHFRCAPNVHYNCSVGKKR